jgi:serine/threonine protein kinase
MDVSAINETLVRYASGDLTDAHLIAQIQSWAGDLPGGIEDLRKHWPADRLPVVRDYFCVAQLGEGASGVVYTAIHLADEPRMVALKLLRLIADADKRRFFEREVEILKRLDCPHIARYLDSGSVGGTPYLAMERVCGKPLDEYLKLRAATLLDKLAIFERVVEAVRELHDAGVIHRDLSPRHVLVDDHGEVRIVDLGISTARGDDWATQVLRTQTQLGSVIGTLKYMSPEQAWGGLYDTDFRADIWALGVMLHEIATDGDYPYSLEPLVGKSQADSLLYRIQNEAPARPQVRDPRFAGGLSTLISRCLAHEPRRRLGSAAELAGDLRRLCESQRITTQPLPLTYRLQRIAIGLALHARTALWSVIVLASVLLIFTLVHVLNVHWFVTPNAYSVETQKRLLKAAHPTGEIELRVVGIFRLHH